MKPSIITSFGNYFLKDIFNAVGGLLPEVQFEVYLLRLIDKFEMVSTGLVSKAEISGGGLVEKRKIVKFLHERLSEAFGNPKPKVSAFATYFPNAFSFVRSGDMKREIKRKSSREKIRNSVEIAISLCEKGWCKFPIVEVVLGGAIQSCACNNCRERAIQGSNGHFDFLIHMSDHEVLIDRTICALRKIVGEIIGKVGATADWRLALEVEPGDAFLLNGPEFCLQLFERIRSIAELDRHIYLNFDIAHFELADFQNLAFEELRPRIVNMHISDHPGVHSRDCGLGVWQFGQSEVERARKIHDVQCDYQKKNSFGVSEAIAVELESSASLDEGIKSLTYLRNFLDTHKILS